MNSEQKKVHKALHSGSQKLWKVVRNYPAIRSATDFSDMGLNLRLRANVIKGKNTELHTLTAVLSRF